MSEDGVLTGLADGVFDGDLTTGAGGAAATSAMGFLRGFPVSLASFTGLFPGLTIGFFNCFYLFSLDLSFLIYLGLLSAFFSISTLVSKSIFLSLTIAFDSIFDLGSFVNGKTTGTNFLCVMPSGVTLIFFLNLGFSGFLGVFGFFCQSSLTFRIYLKRILCLI